MKQRGWPDRRGMGAQSDFISEQFAPSEHYKAQLRTMAETLSAAGWNPCEFDSLATEETVVMAKRNFRIVRENPPLGICEFCNQQFSSATFEHASAGDDIRKQFESHKCEREDASQGPARTVREAT